MRGTDASFTRVMLTAAFSPVSHKCRLVPELSQGRVTTEGEQGVAGTPAGPLNPYDLDDLDVFWLEMVNSEFREMGKRLFISVRHTGCPIPTIPHHYGTPHNILQ